jgi:hypothetical protein
MSDDFEEEIPPPDEQSEDFANFDPAAYLAKRNQLRHIGSDDPVDQEVRRVYTGGRRSGRSTGRGEDVVGAENIPVGLGARLLGGFRSGEGIHIYAEILGELLPLAGRYLPIIGCVIIFICLFVCGGGYLLIRAITH